MPRLPAKDEYTIILDRAISVQYEGYLTPEHLLWMQATVDRMVAEYPELADCEQIEIVAEQILESRPVSSKYWLWRTIPKNSGFIDHLLETFRNPPEYHYLYPRGVAFRNKWQVFPPTKEADLKSNRVSPKDKKENLPVFDISKVPAKYEFMLTTAFKDQAEEFYKELTHITSSSDSRWIQRSFVERLDRFSHIKRADDALGGLITSVMSTVSANFRSMPNWWRSFALSLRRGDGIAAYECCESILNEVKKTNGNDQPIIDESDEFGTSKMGVTN